MAIRIKPADVVWSYAGVRPLHDDGTAAPAEITRDYALRVKADGGAAPVLSVFGGKITTYRKLAEHALEKLTPWFPTCALPGLRPSRYPVLIPQQSRKITGWCGYASAN